MTNSTFLLLCSLTWPLLTTMAHAERIGQVQSAIVNGTRTPRSVGLSPEEQLAIGWISNFTPAGSQPEAFCTGTLITSRIVITAKHCVRNRQAEELTFGVGVLPENAPAMFEIATIDQHPSADVAMLFLRTDVVDTLTQIGRGTGLAETAVQPIAPNRQPLTDSQVAVLLGRTVEVAGYGETQDPSRTGRYFASVEISDITGEFVVVEGNGVAGLCFGDSGGPVIAVNVRGKPVILGVEHAGGESCLGTDYLARLDLIREWVDDGIRRMWAENPDGDVCHDLSFKGRCVGEWVEWCDEEFKVRRRNCQALNSHCVFVDENTGYYCVESPRNCDSTGGFCESPLEGFIQPGARSVSAVGGCSMMPDATATSLFGLLFIYCLRRRARRRHP